MIQKGPLEAREYVIKTLLLILQTLPSVLKEKRDSSRSENCQHSDE